MTCLLKIHRKVLLSTDVCIVVSVHDFISIVRQIPFDMADIDSVGIQDEPMTFLRDLASKKRSPLTTKFTFAPECSEQWLQPWPDGPGTSSSSFFTAFMELDDDVTSCLPSATTEFSPGVCPSGKYLATISQYRDVAGGTSRLWYAACCNEYVYTRVQTV